MTRNQKIALGCGGAGCLGLIVVVIAAALIYFFASSRSPRRDYNDNATTNRNANLNDNSNSDSDSNDNTNSSGTSSTSASSMSEDDKHKLYQAASMTGDEELIRRVNIKIGLFQDDFTPGEKYSEFLTSHITWALRNRDFIQSLDSAEKARAYVDQNFPE